jgi:hypothetical protein
VFVAAMIAGGLGYTLAFDRPEPVKPWFGPGGASNRQPGGNAR